MVMERKFSNTGEVGPLPKIRQETGQPSRHGPGAGRRVVGEEGGLEEGDRGGWPARHRSSYGCGSVGAFASQQGCRNAALWSGSITPPTRVRTPATPVAHTDFTCMYRHMCMWGTHVVQALVNTGSTQTYFSLEMVFRKALKLRVWAVLNGNTRILAPWTPSDRGGNHSF